MEPLPGPRNEFGDESSLSRGVDFLGRGLKISPCHGRGHARPLRVTRKLHIAVQGAQVIVELYMPSGSLAVPRAQPCPKPRQQPEDIVQLGWYLDAGAGCGFAEGIDSSGKIRRAGHY